MTFPFHYQFCIRKEHNLSSDGFLLKELWPKGHPNAHLFQIKVGKNFPADPAINRPIKCSSGSRVSRGGRAVYSRVCCPSVISFSFSILISSIKYFLISNPSISNKTFLHLNWHYCFTKIARLKKLSQSFVVISGLVYTQYNLLYW